MKPYYPIKLGFLFAAIACFSAAFIALRFSGNTLPAISAFTETLHEKEELLDKEMHLLEKELKNLSFEQVFLQKEPHYRNFLEKEGMMLLIGRKDSLIFWSDNAFPFENCSYACFDQNIIKLESGWFEVRKLQPDPQQVIIGLILIKKEYPYENQYLINGFQKDFHLPPQAQIVVNQDLKSSQILNNKGMYLFSVLLDKSMLKESMILRVCLCALGLIFLFLFIHDLYLPINQKLGAYKALLLFTGIMVLFRFITMKYHVPNILYELPIFSPQYYGDASSIWLSSLGDLLINSFLLCYLTYFLGREISFSKNIPARSAQLVKVSICLIITLAFFFLSWIINYLLIAGLIKNSNIDFNVNDLFGLTIYSYIALIIVGFLLLSIFFVANKLVQVGLVLLPERKILIGVFILSVFIYTIFAHLIGTRDLIVIFWPFILIVSIVFIKPQNESTYSFTTTVFLVFLFSLYSVHTFLKHTRLKEIDNRKVFAERLAAEKDPIAEHLFIEVEKRIKTDTLLRSYLTEMPQKPLDFEKRLMQEYFSGYWEKYDIRLTVFDTSCAMLVSTPGTHHTINYFDDLIEKRCENTASEDFYFINDISGKVNYIARIPIFEVSSKKRSAFAYLEMNSKFIPEEVGFPELLLDREIGLNRRLIDYSYAKYKDGLLIGQYGPYAYSTSNSSMPALLGNAYWLNADGYSHLIYKPGPDNFIVVLSRKKEGMIDTLTTFSYLFAFFSLFLLILLFLNQLRKGFLIPVFSFKYRIQLLLVLIVLISLFLFGGGTIYYIEKQYEIKNHEAISEKIHSVLIELEGKLEGENKLNVNLKSYTTYLLKKFSSVFFTDINLYDKNGNLFASSQGQIFDEGLISKKMNPNVYTKIILEEKTEFIHHEKIGKLEYLSAYIPFKNKDGELLAYLNLPYFGRQSELEKEISGFLASLINIYVFLFALSILVTLFISNYVTRPLKLIQEKMRKVNLEAKNELIYWPEKDEIGSLISEYNRMISELAKSAELLAKSERENAWREMAKQVAHEIKNPLTPMKLSVQHMQKTWRKQDPDRDQRMERFTQTLIEQIESLSSIANEFSNFAKMPKSVIEKIDLNTVLRSTIDLYHETPNVQLLFRSNKEAAWVYADKEQLMRVFNNLIKNAIQAIPEERKGIITISIVKESEFVTVEVKDNGNGIRKDQLDKIFVPNFTTKTAGMGLGLAIVKNIIDGFKGKVWFSTEEYNGTSFYVRLPIYIENASSQP